MRRSSCQSASGERPPSPTLSCPNYGQQVSNASHDPLRLLSGGEAAENVVENAAVVEVFELVERVDPADDRHFLHAAVGKRDLGLEPLARRQPVGKAAYGDQFVTTNAERLP